MAYPPVLLLALWLLWLAAALLSVWRVRKFAGYLARNSHYENVDYHPKVTVIVPFRGLDQDLPACLKSHFEQDYPDYRVMMVVDSVEDPAYAVLEREAAQYPQREARIMVAGQAGRDQGQKVHNQLYVLGQIEAGASDDEVWVFADSDAVPGKGWLREMVGPLAAPKQNGVTTGYRWLVPDPAAGPGADPGRGPGSGSVFWSSVASIINSTVASFLWRRSLVFAWGGSMAVRVGTARRGRLMERWRGAITDDYPLTLMCKELGLRVYFVPRCLVATPAAMTLGSLFNFGHRQYLITRVYIPGVYWSVLTLMSLLMAAAASAWVYLVYELAVDAPRSRGRWEWALGAIVAVTLVHLWRARVRRGLIKRTFDAATAARLRTVNHLDAWATPLCTILHWLMVVRAALSREMVWRGIRYRVLGRQRVERLDEM